MVNIIVVTTHFPPRKGGVETANWHLADVLEEIPSVNACILTYNAIHDSSTFVDYWKKVRVLRVGVNKGSLEYMTNAKIVFNLDSMISKIKFAALHWLYLTKGVLKYFSYLRNTEIFFARGAVIETIFGYLLAILMKKKLLVRWHTDIGIFLGNPLVKFMLKKSLEKAEIIGVNGEDIRSDVMSLLDIEDKNRVFCPRLSVNTEIFCPSGSHEPRTMLELPINKFIVLFAASLDKIKFCDLIIDAASEILRVSDDYIFVFIGEGRLDKKVSNLQRIYRNKVRFINASVDPHALSLYLKAANITIGSADVSYLGRLTLESMACGTPVLLFDKPINLEKRAKEIKLDVKLPHLFIVETSIGSITDLLVGKRGFLEDCKINKDLLNVSIEYIRRFHEKRNVLIDELFRFKLINGNAQTSFQTTI